MPICIRLCRKQKSKHSMPCKPKSTLVHLLLMMKVTNSSYRQLSEFLPLVVYSLRLDGQIEYINQRWCSYTGLSLEQSLGSQWVKCVHEDDTPGIMESISSAAKSAKDLDVECRLRVRIINTLTYKWPLTKHLPRNQMALIGGIYWGLRSVLVITKSLVVGLERSWT